MSNNALVELTNKLSTTLGMGANGVELYNTLKATAFKGPVTDAQMTALLVVANHVSIDENGCWNWTGATSRGYGQLTHAGIHQTAHRFAYKHLVEPIKDGMWILHHCDNKLCINPAHLYQGTPVDNRADMLNRGRWKHPWGRREECVQGHRYEQGSYRIASDGSRVCRICHREYMRNRRASMKGEIA